MLASYNKFIVALSMAVLEWIRVTYNIDLGLDESTMTALVGAITSILVFAIPNKSRQ
ncbi:MULTISPECIES: hypothetical protein [Ensifer]|uniref:Uncharacterized protein n=1 Tax=Ensifer adhaerens TaxID=106592 RepID=A0ABY8HE35_ENSAD|nr:hypothetical protein [Ensifer adhaerens]WFP89805.1 hypothetical protein P4B07_14725 [Ensifer adhaerens]